MNQKIPLVDGPVVFAGAVSLEHAEGRHGGIRPWRLIHQRLDMFEPELHERAAHPAGVRMTFVSDTSAVAIDIDALDESFCFDLLIDGNDRRRVTLPTGQTRVAFTDLPDGEHRLEIYLPHRGAAPYIHGLCIDEHATASSWIDTRPKWVVYGSSITQAGNADGPTQTWPVLVANRYDLNLTCLGYGGNCHMEPIVARMIRDLPADYISMCLGINVMGSASLSPRTFRAAVIGMIDITREKHPNTPIVIVSPICNPEREQTPNPVDMTLATMRTTISQVIDLFKHHGDNQLFYQDGLELFGPDLVHHMPDQLHPDAQGYRVLAQRYADIVMPKFGLKPA